MTSDAQIQAGKRVFGINVPTTVSDETGVEGAAGREIQTTALKTTKSVVPRTVSVLVR